MTVEQQGFMTVIVISGDRMAVPLSSQYSTVVHIACNNAVAEVSSFYEMKVV